MVEIVLIVLMVLLALIALFVWWGFDIDLPDIVAATVTPTIGIVLIYVYGTPLVWAGGLVLLAIGAFALAHFVKRRERRANRRGHYRDEN